MAAAVCKAGGGAQRNGSCHRARPAQHAARHCCCPHHHISPLGVCIQLGSDPRLPQPFKVVHTSPTDSDAVEQRNVAFIARSGAAAARTAARALQHLRAHPPPPPAPPARRPPARPARFSRRPLFRVLPRPGLRRGLLFSRWERKTRGGGGRRAAGGTFSRLVSHAARGRVHGPHGAGGAGRGVFVRVDLQRAIDHHHHHHLVVVVALRVPAQRPRAAPSARTKGHEEDYAPASHPPPPIDGHGEQRPRPQAQARYVPCELVKAALAANGGRLARETGMLFAAPLSVVVLCARAPRRHAWDRGCARSNAASARANRSLVFSSFFLFFFFLFFFFFFFHSEAVALPEHLPPCDRCA